MPYYIAEKLSDQTIDSKIELIDYFLNKEQDDESNQADQDILFNYMIEKEKIEQANNYCIIGPKYALGCLVAHFLHLSIDNTDLKQKELLTELLEYVKGFQPSKSSLLNLREIVNLIDLISSFGLPESFLIARDTYIPLRVYLIPYEHQKNNAVYFPHLNSIASYRPKRISAPEYIFIHELGHLLAYSFTGDYTKVPESFLQFNEQFNPKFKGNLIEIFADLFSIAVMIGTGYAYKNPFLSTLSITKQTIIKDYFTKLIIDYKINVLHL